ncbi:MAG: hypothetical protein ACOYB3_01410 [Azonexus sp.]
MKERSFLFVLGTNPYENCHGDYHTRGNGEWHVDAATTEEALQIIFGSMSFPGEVTGRKHFVPGVSLPGVNENEVIQVWNTDPEVCKHTREALGEPGGLHNGRGRDFGLVAEIKVTELDKYCHPIRALLAAPEEAGDPGKGVSPLGASVIKYHEIKHELQHAAQIQKMEVAKKQWEVEGIARQMKEKLALMREQIGVFDAYLHGTRHRTQMCRGNHGTGKYHVYQQRVFLSEEIAILGNFMDMDFQGMEALEKWLVESGHIWKLLPFERCILATRIRQEKKDYGDPLSNVWNNQANMQNMIWIRDGENVFHVDVEYEFHNAVFPRKDQYEQAKTIVQDSVFTKAFKAKSPENWHGQKLKPGEYDVMGKMKRKPLEEAEPYFTRRAVHQRFETMQDWLANPECYTELLDKQINEAVHEFLRERNKKQMLFAVIMQGIVDNTNYLQIPKGTDMFNWENVSTYLELLYDYSHGLPFKGWSDKVEPFINGKAAVGDWIVAKVEEHIPAKERYGNGTDYSESKPILFKVVGLAECDIRRCIGNEWVTAKEKRPVVKYFPKAKRHNYNLSYEDNRGRRTKSPISLTLKSSTFIRVPMSPQYARDILNDREWKQKHRNLVVMMVNYDKIIKVMKTPVNGTVFDWSKDDE